MQAYSACIYLANFAYFFCTPAFQCLFLKNTHRAPLCFQNSINILGGKFLNMGCRTCLHSSIFYIYVPFVHYYNRKDSLGYILGIPCISLIVFAYTVYWHTKVVLERYGIYVQYKKPYLCSCLKSCKQQIGTLESIRLHSGLLFSDWYHTRITWYISTNRGF